MSQVAIDVSNATIDNHVEDEIAACLNLQSLQSFFLFAGAGSGKTRSLINALKYVRKNSGSKLRLRGQRIGVITYTNAACDEIIQRIDFDNLFQVSTIHSFAWQLIGGFNTDIRAWLEANLGSEIIELQDLEAKGRPGTKASITRLSQIQSKKERLQNLGKIKKFIYNPNGDNRETNSLNHSEVMNIAANFLATKPLLQTLLVNKYPFLFVDEGQDTNRHLVDALLEVQSRHRGKFCLGLFGDTMQRIYNDGKERIEAALPNDWHKPVKKLNFRCPKTVVSLINKIRASADGQQQEAISTAIEGCVRLFIFSTSTPVKPALEDAVRHYMADLTKDKLWNEPDQCKNLTLEHHMAAKRMGFEELFEALYEVDEFRTGLLDGSLPVLRLFTDKVSSVVNAHTAGDRFAMAKVVREASPLLSEVALKEANSPRAQLKTAQTAVESLMSLWSQKEPTCGQILEEVARSGLFAVPDSLRPVLALKQIKVVAADGDDQNQADQLPERLAALERFLDTPFSQIGSYARYVSDNGPYGTHQGIKGREFERVMVIIDPSETRGFMFDYEKLFGAKELSATDVKNERDGKETSLDRTRRLFYVTCSRAKKSLAIVAYTESPDAVQRSLIGNGWFAADQIVMSLKR